MNFSPIITGTGLFVPPYSVSNHELVTAYNQYVDEYNQEHQEEIIAGKREELLKSDESFIVKASGVENRYVIEKDGIINSKIMHPIIAERSNDELSIQAEIGLKAAKEALSNASLEASDIDLVILACSNLQRAYPAVSIEIQNALGIDGAAYDMNVACSSATFAIKNASDAIMSGSVGRVLIVNVEICSAHNDFKNRDCHFIFGDAATAIILEKSTLCKDQSKGFKILGTSLKTQFSNNIRNNFGFLNRCDLENKNRPPKLFTQNGRKVFKEVSILASQVLSHHLQSLNISPDDIKRFWLHQANLTMDILILKKILNNRHPTEEELPIILNRFSNTASAGCIISFHLNRDDFSKGEKGLISSFGAGYSVGSIIVEKC